jgi:hypothetical protein
VNYRTSQRPIEIAVKAERASRVETKAAEEVDCESGTERVRTLPFERAGLEGSTKDVDEGLALEVVFLLPRPLREDDSVVCVAAGWTRSLGD